MTSVVMTLATDLTAAWLSRTRSSTGAEAAAGFLRIAYEAIDSCVEAERARAEDREITHVPAVGVRKSLSSPDHIISMIDGKAYGSLRRHLSAHGLTPEQYRIRYGLQPNYPMVAPSYSDARRALARRSGFGKARHEPALDVVSNAHAPTDTFQVSPDEPAVAPRRKLGLAFRI